jgi:hypothetical protein
MLICTLCLLPRVATCLFRTFSGLLTFRAFALASDMPPKVVASKELQKGKAAKDAGVVPTVDRRVDGTTPSAVGAGCLVSGSVSAVGEAVLQQAVALDGTDVVAVSPEKGDKVYEHYFVIHKELCTYFKFETKELANNFVSASMTFTPENAVHYRVVGFDIESEVENFIGGLKILNKKNIDSIVDTTANR